MDLSPNMCCSCEKNGESHIFLYCKFSKNISGLAFEWVMPNRLMYLFNQWGGGGKGKRGKFFLEAFAQGVLWGIWKKRNQRIF